MYLKHFKNIKNKKIIKQFKNSLLTIIKNKKYKKVFKNNLLTIS